VKAWSEAGHAIGNHTYAHRNLASAKTAVDAYTADIAREEQLSADCRDSRSGCAFPFLKEGDTTEKRTVCATGSRRTAIARGAVTIDTSDWYYDQRFIAWKKKHPRDDPAPFRRAYLAHLSSRIAYYDGLSRQLFHRSVKHVCCCTRNRRSTPHSCPTYSTCCARMAGRSCGQARPTAIPVYSLRPDVLPAGESLLWSLAKAAKLRDLRYPGEDDRYEKPLLDALGL